jgi:hypothetical protein
MNIADWVLIGTTLFLGIIALITPVVSEALKRRFFAPELRVTFDRTPPYCHRTYWSSNSIPGLKEPVYFFRFKLENAGKSQLRKVEAVLEEFWIHDAAGLPEKFLGFTDINLRWSGTDDRFVNVNPGRQVYCDIGHISSIKYQKAFEEKIFIDVPGHHEDSLRFLFDEIQYPFSQPNCLLPGKYSIKISLYSENASPRSFYFEIVWTGNWQDTDKEMFRELSIRQVSKV